MQALTSDRPLFSKSVSVLCWAFNESLLIEGFLRRLNALLAQSVSQYEIVIVDDCSTDDTKAKIKTLQQEIPQIVLVENPVNMNVGLSQRRAIQAASKDYVMWQTVDWSYDISHLRENLELLKSYDVVAGVRRPATQAAGSWLARIRTFFQVFSYDHFTKRSDTLSKAFISIVNYGLIRTLFHLPVSDYQNVVIYPRELIQGFTMETRSSFSNPECLIKAYWLGASIAEVYIPFLRRKAGEAKGTKLKAIVASIQDILSLWFRWMILNQRKFVRNGEVKRLTIEDWKAYARHTACEVA